MTGPARTRLLRIGGLVLFLIVLAVIAEVTGLRKSFSLRHMRTLVLDAGAWGILAYVGLFVVGELFHFPGLVFVAVGVTIWGYAWGGLVSWLTALVSVAVSFWVVRSVGGQPFAAAKHPFIVKMLAHLEERPIRTVALLRAVFMIAPTVTYALALTPVRFRDVMIGSAIGLVPPMVLASVFLVRLLHWLGG